MEKVMNFLLVCLLCFGALFLFGVPAILVATVIYEAFCQSVWAGIAAIWVCCAIIFAYWATG